ncbi:MAG TPA: shikimate kinase [Syntrophomonadaceae bacterium]|nr:shikimate kinase [Syntrophomonadaceae bacterium]HNX27850.1 shikimate kinase [Syntrophomonadaceae bacterium]HPR93642.1 shikimate kinase [Syntrophomonadaceae bacterium]
MGKNIVLTGFMGTGKSTVGMKLAERLKMEFVDLDREIERVTGMSVSQIFKRYGEIRFRSEENLMAAKLAKKENLVIATGGGTVLQENNIETFRENGLIICLEADPEDIFARVNRKRGTRPLLKKNLTIEDIKKMLADRSFFYQQADYRLNTSGKDLDSIVKEIIGLIQKQGG